jgi:hypothetical protein
MFHTTVWTDFGIPSAHDFATLSAAHEHGKAAIAELGCARYTIKIRHIPGGWQTVFDTEAAA